MGTSSDKIGPFTFYRGSTNITDKVTITGATVSNLVTTQMAGNATETAVVTFNTEEVITKDTSQTYYLKASVTGVSAVGENIQTYIKDDTTYAVPAAYSLVTPNNFVWTDKAWPSLFHGLTTADWLNGYLVRTLPTDTYTLSK
jgi:predicted RND superfamily exporter protein